MTQLMPNVHFNAGDTICSEGYAGDGAYLICSGKVEVFKEREGKITTLAKLGEDKIFGEIALIDDWPRSASVKATEDTWCYFHNKDSFQEKLEQADSSIIRVFKELAESIRKKNKIIMATEHENIEPDDIQMALAQIAPSLAEYAPDRSKESIINDENLQEQISRMDIFMRTAFKSLMNVAYS